MRKIVLCAVSIVIILSMAIAGYAFVNASGYDSGKIPLQVLEIIQPEEGDVVIRVYNMNIGYTFCENDHDIGKILGGFNEHYITYHKITDSEVIGYSRDSNGIYGEAIAFWYPERDNPALQQWLSGEAIKAVDSDIVVKSAFYLGGEIYGMGTAIYYMTNLGDYVYYHKGDIDCLVTLDVFAELQSAAYEMLGDGFISLKYDEDVFKQFDFSPYDYRSANFDPHAPLREKTSPYLIWGCIGGGMAVLAAAAVTTVLIIRKKKKTTVQEEMEPTPEET